MERKKPVYKNLPPPPKKKKKTHKKSSILKLNLWDYSDAYIHVKGSIIVPKIAGVGQATNNNGNEIVSKNYRLHK